MPNLTLSIPHQLTRIEAKQRVQGLVAQLQRDLGGSLGAVEERWTGDTLAFTLSVTGTVVTGQVFVEDQLVRMEVALPWLFAMLANRIQEHLTHEGHLLLEHR